jgi:hypothetical protein
MANFMRDMFRGLGVSDNACISMVDEQGIDDLDELRVLKDSEVTNLCKVVRRPGGMLEPVGGRPSLPDHGEMVSLRAENNIKLACFWLRHRIRVGRTTAIGDVTLARVREVRDLRDNEDKYESLTKPVINEKDWPKTMEAIEEWLRGTYGQTKIPLAYVVRRNEEAPAGPDPADGYMSIYEEMIARAPHRVGGPGTNRTPTLTVDNNQVFEMIASITREHDCWTYVKPAQRRRDGRQAFLAMWNHYLGPNNVDNMASMAERKMTSTTYTGEKKRWNFEKYVKVHMDQHQVIENLMEHGHAGIDERSKTRWLLDGIKTEELDVVKTQILANPALHTDFTGCVTLYKDFLAQKASTANAILNVSAVHHEYAKVKKRGAQSSGNGKKGPITGIEDRYYNGKEFGKLSKDERDELTTMREVRTGKKSKSNKWEKKKESSVASLTRTVASLLTSVTELKDEVRKSDEADESEEETVMVSNRSNKNLTRQKKK